MDREPVPRPPLRLALLEQRALLEFASFLASMPALRLVGRGDSHPVLVLPGFATSDSSTRPLRSILRAQGYWVHGWRLGRNLPDPGMIGAVAERLTALHGHHGAPVSMVGISWGGVLAREVARLHPELVRQVITMGSPFRQRPGDRSTLSFVYDRRPPPPVPPGWDVPEEDRPPLPVPSTAIYSRSDGIVRWHLCVDEAGPGRENVEVRGSHSGLAHNPAAVFVVSDRLAQARGRWRPFRAPLGTGRCFPRAENWIPRQQRHRAG
jgi:pimeloyl-ACP methyl ester carboxylesterase